MFNFLRPKKETQHSLSERKTNIKDFMLCSQESSRYALSVVEKLISYNESNSLLFKTYKALDCSKEDLVKSLYFLQDVTLFCKEDPLYNNSDLRNKLRFLYSQVLTYYLDVPTEALPADKKENYAFGRQFNLLAYLGPRELENLTLVNWRNSEQWKFWGSKYGDNELGDYCRLKAQEV